MRLKPSCIREGEHAVPETFLLSHKAAKRLASRMAKTEMGLPYGLAVAAPLTRKFWRLKQTKLQMIVDSGRVEGQGPNKVR
jgi:hypothetical protein